MVFFEQLLEDDEIDPELSNERLQEDGGEFLDTANQFTTEMVGDPKDHYIPDNLANKKSDKEPIETIAEGGHAAVQTGVTAFEIPSPTPSLKFLFCAHKWNCHHILELNWRSLPYLKEDPFPTKFSP